MRIFSRSPKPLDPEDHVKLIVTGVCKDTCKEKLKADCKAKGVKAVVTDVPVLGVFDIK